MTDPRFERRNVGGGCRALRGIERQRLRPHERSARGIEHRRTAAEARHPNALAFEQFGERAIAAARGVVRRIGIETHARPAGRCCHTANATSASVATTKIAGLEARQARGARASARDHRRTAGSNAAYARSAAAKSLAAGSLGRVRRAHEALRQIVEGRRGFATRTPHLAAIFARRARGIERHERAFVERRERRGEQRRDRPHRSRRAPRRRARARATLRTRPLGERRRRARWAARRPAPGAPNARSSRNATYPNAPSRDDDQHDADESAGRVRRREGVAERPQDRGEHVTDPCPERIERRRFRRDVRGRSEIAIRRLRENVAHDARRIAVGPRRHVVSAVSRRARCAASVRSRPSSRTRRSK